MAKNVLGLQVFQGTDCTFFCNVAKELCRTNSARKMGMMLLEYSITICKGVLRFRRGNSRTYLFTD